jgi:LysM repeat protein
MTPPRRLRAVLAALTLCLALAGTCFTQQAYAVQQTYVVQGNDTLSSIAQRFGTTVSALMAANGIANPDRIYVGEVLQMGDCSMPSGSTATTTGVSYASASSAGTSYTIQPGDTLSSISARFGVSLSSLAAANGIADPSSIRSGEQLVIPSQGGGAMASGIVSASAVSSSASTGGAYAVQAGDTLSTISARFGVTPDALAAANRLSLNSIITVGQQLTVPAASNFAAASAVQTSSADYGAILTAQAEAAGVDPALVKAVAWQESGWQMVTAFDGGMGIMQLMPDSVTWASDALLGYQINPYDPTDNVRAGVAMLRFYLQKYGGNVQDALAAYHQGMGSLASQGILPETQQYISNILTLQQRFAA